MVKRPSFHSSGRGTAQRTAKRADEKAGTSATLPKWTYAALAQRVLQEPLDEISGDEGTSKAGRLHIVGTPIGHRGDITLRALVTLAQADAVLCEDTRVSGALLRGYGIRTPLESYHDHNEGERAAGIVARLQGGANLALVSDAGMPLIADPGFRLVRACRAAGVPVTVCPGPTALAAGLALASLPLQAFLFGGFLPPKSGARRKALMQWRETPAALVFYEAPSRLAEALEDMAAVLGDRAAAVGRELTKLYEECRRDSLTALAAHYRAAAPKGEIVVMVAPPEEKAAAGEDDVRALLRAALREGSLRDAVARVALESGMAREAVYKLALQMKDA